MPLDLIYGLALFAFVSSITPGPNNLMLIASGANFGILRSLPHMLGIAIGLQIMVILMALGLAGVFDRFPITQTVLKIVAVVYMLWLAWKIATAAPIDKQDIKGKPLTFLQAAAFQWVNPKTWAMAITAIGAYMPEATLSIVATITILFAAINLPCMACWALIGRQMARFLTNPRRMVLFNRAMAVLLVASLYPVVVA